MVAVAAPHKKSHGTVLPGRMVTFCHMLAHLAHARTTVLATLGSSSGIACARLALSSLSPPPGLSPSALHTLVVAHSVLLSSIYPHGAEQVWAKKLENAWPHDAHTRFPASSPAPPAPPAPPLTPCSPCLTVCAPGNRNQALRNAVDVPVGVGTAASGAAATSLRLAALSCELVLRQDACIAPLSSSRSRAAAPLLPEMPPPIPPRLSSPPGPPTPPPPRPEYTSRARSRSGDDVSYMQESPASSST